MNPEKKAYYNLDEGGFLEAATPLGMINTLRQHYKMLELDQGDFMDEVARRYQKKGRVIRTDTVLHFVYDLINTGSILLPNPFPERDVLNYAKLYMEVAIPNSLPDNWKVLTDFYPYDKETTGLRVRVKGTILEPLASIYVEHVFSPKELGDIGTWHTKAAHLAYTARNGS